MAPQSRSRRLKARLLFDENFRKPVARRLRLRLPSVDQATVQMLGLHGISDPDLLEYAWQNGYVVVSHDLRTFPRYVHERLAAGHRLAGVIMVRWHSDVVGVLDKLERTILESDADDFVDQVVILPE